MKMMDRLYCGRLLVSINIYLGVCRQTENPPHSTLAPLMLAPTGNVCCCWLGVVRLTLSLVRGVRVCRRQDVDQ